MNNTSTNNTATNNNTTVPAQTCNPDFAILDACGGDLVGTWNAQDVCGEYDLSDLVALCPTATATTTSLDMTGTVTFTAGGGDTRDTTVTALGELTIPAICLQGQAATGCSTAQMLLNQQSGVTATCALSGGSCVCDTK